MKRLTLAGLADYMTASPTRQRSILREYKYPDEDEPRVKILYYREARDRISAFHRGRHNANWLIAESHHLRSIEALSTGPRATRLRNNAQVVQAYARNFGDREFEILEIPRLQYSHRDVVISVFPDLHVREGNREKIVKLEFGVNEPTQDQIRIISQLMFEAANQAGMGLTSASVLYFDVRRGFEHRGARLGTRLRSDIEATCENLSAIWDSV